MARPGPPGYYAHVLAAMPGTPKDLRDKTGFAPRTVTGLLKKARDLGDCHIGSWQRSPGSGNIQPVYVAGPGVNKPCLLKALTSSQINKRCWKRMKKDPERMEARQATDMARYYANKAKRKGDPLVNALFGRST